MMYFKKFCNPGTNLEMEDLESDAPIATSTPKKRRKTNLPTSTMDEDCSEFSVLFYSDDSVSFKEDSFLFYPSTQENAGEDSSFLFYSDNEEDLEREH